MIGRLSGVIAERGPSHVIVDCHGVGYLVTLSAYSAGRLPVDRVTLNIYTHAQENRIALFGFVEAAEREIFDLLITVKNVGPQTAMGILSGGATPYELADSIAREQVIALTRLKGVGKKTAELVVVELREKCSKLLVSWGASVGAAAVRTRSPLLDEVVVALVGLGWREGDAQQIAAELEVGPESTLESLIRAALLALKR